MRKLVRRTGLIEKYSHLTMPKDPHTRVQMNAKLFSLHCISVNFLAKKESIL